MKHLFLNASSLSRNIMHFMPVSLLFSEVFIQKEAMYSMCKYTKYKGLLYVSYISLFFDI